MKGGFRQSMAWLHTWSGLLLGWLLFAIFFTGTAAYFRQEISVWMRPEFPAAPADPHPVGARALQRIAGLAAGAPSWLILLPDDRDPVVHASWRDPAAARGFRTVHLDPGSGAVLAGRDTLGGDLFYRFHFQLFYLPVPVGRWIVGIAALMMLVAIISGIVTHRRIFADFFTFRPRKGQRSWLDAHAVSTVLALPFHLMITYTGLITLMAVLMPWGIQAGYQGAPQRFLLDAYGIAPPSRPIGRPAPLAPLAPMLAEAERRWNGTEAERRWTGTEAERRWTGTEAERRWTGTEAERRWTGTEAERRWTGTEAERRWTGTEAERRWTGTEAGRITVSNAGDAGATVEIVESDRRRLSYRAQAVLFDGTTGAVLAVRPPAGPAAATFGMLYGLHIARFADGPLRGLLFLCGLAGTIMIGTGLVLWTVKRRRNDARAGFGTRLVERLNLAALAGLPVGVAACFWANRLLPIKLADRADAEVHVLFAAWGTCLLHALLRPGRQGWREQFGLAALLFALLPALNAATTGRHDGIFVAFDLAMSALAGTAGAAAIMTGPRRQPARPAIADPAVSDV